jgi:hypothetical protein
MKGGNPRVSKGAKVELECDLADAWASAFDELKFRPLAQSLEYWIPRVKVSYSGRKFNIHSENSIFRAKVSYSE